MSRLPQFLLLLFFCNTLFGQVPPHSLQRLSLDPQLAPFYHGVASGDPLPDAVIIWTRVTVEDVSATVSWKVSQDTLFTTLVANGTATTDASRDYTVKVDVTGLQPATYYYYQFEHNGRKSLIGRTKTAPAGNNTHIRFAVVSCSDYESGYFNAYEHIMYRNDIDAVLHLGDYIYEYATDGLTGNIPGRVTDPPHEIITLDDYRARYSHYRLDPQLRGLHQQYPFITTWDDHETANNSWVGGAENHDPNTEGDWFVRKANGKQAYFEWLPVRESTVDPLRIYRKLNYGKLADLLVLDTRLEGRDQQSTTTNQDPNRTILGQDQYNWLTANLSDTTTVWKIVAQQVMMAPLTLGTVVLNQDQWDGYPQERLKLFNYILNNNIQNFVVLTGDIHTSWANELKISGLNSVGAEFVTTSVTTSNAGIIGIPFNPASIFPHVKWADLNNHGYIIVDITPGRTQSDWYFMQTIAQRDTSATLAASWFIPSGSRTLNEASAPAPGLTGQAPLAPFTVDNSTVGLADLNPEMILLGTYPNPFTDKLLVQFYLRETGSLHLKLLDISGRLVYEQTTALKQPGVNYAQIPASFLAPGYYVLETTAGSTTLTRTVFRAKSH
ncbi:MAG: alkaline phosphatase D [Chitinophagales bacterium]|nr:MAG: alkaline phosphatase D [Chitinophagales bacterium]